MKAIAFLFTTFLAFGAATTSAANADEQCSGSGCNRVRSIVGPALDVAQQYAKGGPFSGVTSGTTGTALDVARDSMNFLGSLDRIASTRLERKFHPYTRDTILFAGSTAPSR